MARESLKTARFKVSFPETVVGEPLMPTFYKQASDLDVTPNILRGRITDKNAWLEVELAGTAKNVEKLLKFFSDRGITFQKLDG